MLAQFPSMNDLASETQHFYRRAVQLLREADVPFLVGGAYALAHYTGIVRHTKDFDVFLRRRDYPRALKVFAEAGFHTEVTFSHWLAKAFHGEDFVDFIFSSGNGIAKVDDVWFDNAVRASFLGEPVLLCPAEETIWSKGFVCERERFDGADINHLLLVRGPLLNWQRLLDRFGPHWRMLMTHLLMFGFTYPSDRHKVPAWVMTELSERLENEIHSLPPKRRVCQGTLLSRTQYVIDVGRWGYADARLDGESGMTERQTEVWTDAGLRE